MSSFVASKPGRTSRVAEGGGSSVGWPSHRPTLSSERPSGPSASKSSMNVGDPVGIHPPRQELGRRFGARLIPVAEKTPVHRGVGGSDAQVGHPDAVGAQHLRPGLGQPVQRPLGRVVQVQVDPPGRPPLTPAMPVSLWPTSRLSSAAACSTSGRVSHMVTAWSPPPQPGPGVPAKDRPTPGGGASDDRGAVFQCEHHASWLSRRTPPFQSRRPAGRRIARRPRSSASIASTIW
jgi:hypothetical protein